MGEGQNQSTPPGKTRGVGAVKVQRGSRRLKEVRRQRLDAWTSGIVRSFA